MSFCWAFWGCMVMLSGIACEQRVNQEAFHPDIAWSVYQQDSSSVSLIVHKEDVQTFVDKLSLPPWLEGYLRSLTDGQPERKM
ncbi:MAG: hypothetical protein ACKO5C_04255, partial [Ferruginibacter sp.]